VLHCRKGDLLTLSKDELFQASVVVTGTHYSMSTLVGQILGQAPEFNVVHEPLNAEPTLGYNALGPDNWYEYYAGKRYTEMRAALRGYMFGEGLAGQTLSRSLKIRSRHDLLRVGKYVQTNLALKRHPRRAVFKDPFLAFSGYLLQKHDGLPIVLCLRHPCAFAESLKRRGSGFDFTGLARQPALLAEFPAETTERIEYFSREKQPVIDQAALLWKAVYGFAADHYLASPNTHLIRQEDLAHDPIPVVDALFAALGATRTAEVDNFLKASLQAETPADFAHNGSSYVHRNARETTVKWKSRLSLEEIKSITQIVGESGAAFGYKFT
jgi:hypothetical protein